MTEFSQNIVGKIKKEHIAPVPRWHFLLKSYAFWVLLGVSILLGSFSFSVIVHILASGDFDMAQHLQGNMFVSAVMLLPYFWFLSLCVCELIAYYNWKHTRMGYRFRRRWIFLASIVISVLSGSVMYSAGMGAAIDRLMTQSVPFYGQSKQSARVEIWMQPDKGLLVGRVIRQGDLPETIYIRDEEGNDWMIDESQLQPPMPPTFKEGKTVKIIGERDGVYQFVAREIRKCIDCWNDGMSDN